MEEDITGLLEVNVPGGCPMELYSSILPIDFSMDVQSSTRRPNTETLGL